MKSWSGILGESRLHRCQILLFLTALNSGVPGLYRTRHRGSPLQRRCASKTQCLVLYSSVHGQKHQIRCFPKGLENWFLSNGTSETPSHQAPGCNRTLWTRIWEDFIHLLMTGLEHKTLGAWGIAWAKGPEGWNTRHPSAEKFARLSWGYVMCPVKWVPLLWKITEAVPQVGPMFSNSFFATKSTAIFQQGKASNLPKNTNTVTRTYW